MLGSNLKMTYFLGMKNLIKPILYRDLTSLKKQTYFQFNIELTSTKKIPCVNKLPKVTEVISPILSWNMMRKTMMGLGGHT